ncbi:unnamed protein product, partial [Symbiodinium microadriaticum]
RSGLKVAVQADWGTVSGRSCTRWTLRRALPTVEDDVLVLARLRVYFCVFGLRDMHVSSWANQQVGSHVPKEGQGAPISAQGKGLAVASRALASEEYHEMRLASACQGQDLKPPLKPACKHAVRGWDFTGASNSSSVSGSAQDLIGIGSFSRFENERFTSGVEGYFWVTQSASHAATFCETDSCEEEVTETLLPLNLEGRRMVQDVPSAFAAAQLDQVFLTFVAKDDPTQKAAMLAYLGFGSGFQPAAPLHLAEVLGLRGLKRQACRNTLLRGTVPMAVLELASLCIVLRHSAAHVVQKPSDR